MYARILLMRNDLQSTAPLKPPYRGLSVRLGATASHPPPALSIMGIRRAVPVVETEPLRADGGISAIRAVFRFPNYTLLRPDPL